MSTPIDSAVTYVLDQSMHRVVPGAVYADRDDKSESQAPCAGFSGSIAPARAGQLRAFGPTGAAHEYPRSGHPSSTANALVDSSSVGCLHVCYDT